MLRFVLLLLAGWAAAVARANDVYRAEFARPLSRVFRQRLERELGYPCTGYLSARTLELFLNASSHTRLSTYFAPALVALTVVPMAARCAPALETAVADAAAHTTTSHELRAHRLDGAAHTIRYGAAANASMVVRAHVHRGALATWDINRWRAHIRAALASFVSETDDAPPPTTPRLATTVDETLVRLEGVRPVDAATLARHVLARVHCIRYMDIERTPVLANLWSVSSTQRPGAISATSVAVADACSDAVCRPLWAAGLRGAGQLIAMSDTGVATTSCFFHDGTAAVPFVTGLGSVPADTGHRRLRVYSTGSGGDSSDSNRHGTHVAGIALGAPEPGVGPADSPSALDVNDFAGGAPDARLVFVDVQSGNGGLAVPTPYVGTCRPQTPGSLARTGTTLRCSRTCMRPALAFTRARGALTTTCTRTRIGASISFAGSIVPFLPSLPRATTARRAAPPPSCRRRSPRTHMPSALR